MGGKRGKKRRGNATPVSQPYVSMTLREEAGGKKQGHVNAKTMCKVDHLKTLAVWAATEASILSLGAFFGERLAVTTEALGIRSDPSLFVCERCESVLQPGQNCTIRIERNKAKKRYRHAKSYLTTQNNVVYTCHFCSHQNLMRGTPKGYMKEICPPKAKLTSKTQPGKKHPSSAKPRTNIPTINTVAAVALPAVDAQNLEPSTPAPAPAPPSPVTNVSLLESKRRKRNRSTAKKVAEVETISTVVDADKSVQASSKRRKKSWTSLKEIVQSSEQDSSKRKLTNLAIPFFIS